MDLMLRNSVTLKSNCVEFDAIKNHSGNSPEFGGIKSIEFDAFKINYLTG